MRSEQERILIVETDPDISDLIARQALKPFGHRIKIVDSAGKAIQEAATFSPDLLIININLPGLSGKDLLVSLSSQGLKVPVIVMADEGMEDDVIQAFRLGAADYLKRPLREAEIVSAVERALKQVRERKERRRLAQKLEKTNHELNRRVRDLTTIFNIGKTVTSITDQRELFERIVKGAVIVAEADRGWLHLRKGNSKSFVLSAFENLSKSIGAKVDQQWDDGISSLVALSGEPLSIYGEPLEKFKVARFGKAALVIPVKAQNEVVGVLVVVRKKPIPFDADNQAMLEVVSDYASISLMNARLFQALEERARTLQTAVEKTHGSEQVKTELMTNLYQKLHSPVNLIRQKLNELENEDGSKLVERKNELILDLRNQIEKIGRISDAISDLSQVGSHQERVIVNIVDLARKALSQHRQLADEKSIVIEEKLPRQPIFVHVDTDQMAIVFNALLSNAVQFSSIGGDVVLSVQRNSMDIPQVTVQDSGPGFTGVPEDAFLPFFDGADNRSDRIGIGLTLAREIVENHGGKIWIDEAAKNGAQIHFTLPSSDIPDFTEPG